VGSGDGMQQEAETRRNEPPPEDIAGMHFEQVAGNGQDAELSGPLVGPIPGSMEASATLSVGNPVPVAALPARLSYVSGAHAPTVGAMPGDRSRLPDPSLPRMPHLRMGYLPAVGRMLPAPITAMVRTTATTTITLTAAVSAAQAKLVYTSYISPRAPTSGMYAIHPMYGAADYLYQMGLMLIDPRGLGVNGYPDAGCTEIGAVGEVPIGAAGYPEPGERPEQGSLGERTGAVPCCKQVTVGGYGARPKEARTTRYYGQVRLVPPDITSPVGIPSGLFQTTDVPELTWPESPAATSTLPVGHHPSGWASNRRSCTLVSDRPTLTPASPRDHNQHTSDSRSSRDQPRLLNS